MQIAHGWGLSDVVGRRETERIRILEHTLSYDVGIVPYADRSAKVYGVGSVEVNPKERCAISLSIVIDSTRLAQGYEGDSK